MPLRRSRLAIFVLIVAGLAQSEPVLAQQTGHGRIQAHRALYTLALDTTRPSGNIVGADGQLTFDLEQTSCSWFRATTTMTANFQGSNGRRQTNVARTEVSENATGSEIHFRTRQEMDGRQMQASDGLASRAADGVTIRLRAPEAKEVSIGSDVLFPVQHLVSVIEAADAGRSQHVARLYNGSETGVKIVRVNTQIGAKSRGIRSPDARAIDAWSVVLGYFAEAPSPSALPEYEIAGTLQANGIFTDLKFTFKDFALKGILTKLDFPSGSQCE